MNKYVPIVWTISRGHDTYGYNICTLWDDRKAYRCSGGGYDMEGTVVGNYLEAQHQVALMAIAKRAGTQLRVSRDPKGLTRYTRRDGGKNCLYGMTAYHDAHGKLTKVVIDGACGIESVRKIAEAAGISVTQDWSERKRRVVAFFISTKEEAHA